MATHGRHETFQCRDLGRERAGRRRRISDERHCRRDQDSAHAEQPGDLQPCQPAGTSDLSDASSVAAVSNRCRACCCQQDWQPSSNTPHDFRSETGVGRRARRANSLYLLRVGTRFRGASRFLPDPLSAGWGQIRKMFGNDTSYRASGVTRPRKTPVLALSATRQNRFTTFAARFTPQWNTTMKIESLEKLFVDELKDIYSAESQLIRALPKMAKTATSPMLREAFESHLEETKVQKERLDQIGEALDVRLTGKKCAAMEGLLEEGKEILEADGLPSLIDAALIAAAQRVEHYEISAYGTARRSRPAPRLRGCGETARRDDSRRRRRRSQADEDRRKRSLSRRRDRDGRGRERIHVKRQIKGRHEEGRKKVTGEVAASQNGHSNASPAKSRFLLGLRPMI